MDFHGHATTIVDIDAVDVARAQEYALLATVLGRAPDDGLLRQLAELCAGPGPLGIAHGALAEAASRATREAVEREHFDLFVGLGRGELLPYGSYYLAGFLHERPLARLRYDLPRLGIERVPGRAEPEDHAAILCEIMAGVVGGGLSAPLGADRALFEAHLAPWMEKFFADLEVAKTAAFYRSVGALGRAFMAIEAEAFAMSS